MIPALVGILLLPVFTVACVYLLDRAGLLGRSAADPDKETPPPGWADTITLEPPASFPRDCCDWCGDRIPHRETVWMEAASGRVLHVRCRERELDHEERAAAQG